MWYAYAVGFGYAIIVGYLLIKPVMFIMWSYEDRSLKSRWQPALIGVIERIFYISSLLMNHYEFIGLWLILKMAGHILGKEPSDRIFYMETLIGNAISLLYAGVGFQMISWIKKEEWFWAAIIPSLLITATYYFYRYLETLANKNQKS